MDIDDNLILVDSQTKFNIERNPIKTKDIVKNFSLYRFGDENLKGYFVKNINNGKLTPLEEYKECGYLVDSGIYNNVYYPLESFNELYKKDYNNVLSRICFKIGAKSFSLSYSDEKEYSEEEKYSHSANAEMKAPIVKADASANIKDKNGLKQYNKNERNVEISMNKMELSKERFKNWIEKENINIKAFDIIEPYIERYFDNGKIDLGNFEKKDIEISHNINTHEKRKTISAGFKSIPANIKGKFDYDYEKLGSSEVKIARMFKIRVEF